MITRAAAVGFLFGVVVGGVCAWLVGLVTLPGRFTFKTEDLVTTRHDTATGEVVVYVVDAKETKVRRLNLTEIADRNR
jgi:hypothetical protein